MVLPLIAASITLEGAQQVVGGLLSAFELFNQALAKAELTSANQKNLLKVTQKIGLLHQKLEDLVKSYEQQGVETALPAPVEEFFSEVQNTMVHAQKLAQKTHDKSYFKRFFQSEDIERQCEKLDEEIRMNLILFGLVAQVSLMQSANQLQQGQLHLSAKLDAQSQILEQLPQMFKLQRKASMATAEVLNSPVEEHRNSPNAFFASLNDPEVVSISPAKSGGREIVFNALKELKSTLDSTHHARLTKCFNNGFNENLNSKDRTLDLSLLAWGLSPTHHAAASVAFEMEATCCNSVGNTEGEAVAWLNAGRENFKVGLNARSAVDSFEKALSLFSRAGQVVRVGDTYRQLGNLYSTLEPETAERHFHNAANAYHRARLAEEEASIYDALAALNVATKNEDKAMENYGKAASLYVRVNNFKKQAEALFNLASMPSADHKTALKAYEEAAVAYDHLGAVGNPDQATCLVRVAELQETLDPASSLSSFKKASELFQKTSQPEEQVAILLKMAKLLERTDGTEAIRTYSKAAELFRYLGRTAQEAEVWFEIAELETDPGVSGPLFRKAAELYSAAKLPLKQGQTLIRLADHQHAHDSAASLKALSEAATIYHNANELTKEAEVLVRIGEQQRHSSRQNSLESFKQAKAIYAKAASPLDEAMVALRLASLQRHADVGAAISNYQRAAALFETENLPEERAEALGELGRLLKATDPETASSRLIRGISLLRKASHPCKYGSLAVQLLDLARIKEKADPAMSLNLFEEAGKMLTICTDPHGVEALCSREPPCSGGPGERKLEYWVESIGGLSEVANLRNEVQLAIDRLGGGRSRNGSVTAGIKEITLQGSGNIVVTGADESPVADSTRPRLARQRGISRGGRPPREQIRGNSDSSEEPGPQTPNSLDVNVSAVLHRSHSSPDMIAIESLSVSPKPITAEKNRMERNPLPAGWTEAKDPTTGRSYFIDHNTHSTTWTDPRLTTLHPVVSSPQLHVAANLWEECRLASGKKMWVHIETNETRFTPP